jgi:hypothetical protein
MNTPVSQRDWNIKIMSHFNMTNVNDADIWWYRKTNHLELTDIGFSHFKEANIPFYKCSFEPKLKQLTLRHVMGLHKMKCPYYLNLKKGELWVTSQSTAALFVLIGDFDNFCVSI